jgi:hypothetical protein
VTPSIFQTEGDHRGEYLFRTLKGNELYYSELFPSDWKEDTTTCSECNKTYEKHDSFRQHWEEKHQTSKNYPCSKCSVKFVSHKRCECHKYGRGKQRHGSRKIRRLIEIIIQENDGRWGQRSHLQTQNDEQSGLYKWTSLMNRIFHYSQPFLLGMAESSELGTYIRQLQHVHKEYIGLEG